MKRTALNFSSIGSRGWLGKGVFLSLFLLLWLEMMPEVVAEACCSFGVLPQRSAMLTAGYWNPILDYVSRRSGIPLALHTTRTVPEFNQSLMAGTFDVVYSNTIFQPAMGEAAYRVILRPRSEAITGQLVTLEDSAIQKVAALHRQTVGFPSRGAFVGYALPMDHLLRQGMVVEPVFGGNQEGIMGQLKAGRVKAIGVNNQVMADFAKREGVRYRVLWQSEPYFNLPIAVHPRLEASQVEALTRTLATMHQDEEGLAILSNSAATLRQSPPLGFQPASPEDYRNYQRFYQETLVKDIE